MNDLSAIPTQDLRRELAHIQGVASLVIIKVCAILAELKRRKEPHPAFANPIYRWCAEIDAGKLDPEFVMQHCAQPDLIRAALAVPVDVQAEWAAGGAVIVAQKNRAGEWKPAEVQPSRLSASDVDVVFGPKGLRDFPEQVKIRGKAESAKPKPAAKVYAAKRLGHLVVNGAPVSIDDLRKPLRLLGYEIREMADH